MAKRFRDDLILDGKAEKTVKAYLTAMAQLCEHFSCSPDLLSEEQVRAFLLSRREQLMVNSMRPLLGSLKFFFRVTVPREWATLQAMRLPKHRTVPKVLSPHKCWQIIATAKTLHLRAALQTAYTCGLRVGDVCQLKPADVAADRRSLIVRRSKGRDERIVPLPDSTLQLLRTYWAEHRNGEWLFPSRARRKHLATAARPVSERSLQRGLKCVLQSLGWQDRDIVFHTLRHSYATALLDEGVNLKVLQRYLGHKNLQATEVYLHLSRRADQRARQIVSDIMNGPSETADPGNDDSPPLPPDWPPPQPRKDDGSELR